MPRFPPGRRAARLPGIPLPAEVILASSVGAFWVYKGGRRIFSRPLADITRYWQGIPFLAPEVVLLIKARPASDNNQRDFEAALPMLSAEQRSWLKDAIERQPWLKEAIERQPRPTGHHKAGHRDAAGRHRRAAELATDPHRPA